MKRIIPADIYKGVPCSAVAVGCALGVSSQAAVKRLMSPGLRGHGWLSFKDMNILIRAHLGVLQRGRYRGSDRPTLRDFAHSHRGQRAILCVASHYIYFDGRDYYSFFWNGGSLVNEIWFLA